MQQDRLNQERVNWRRNHPFGFWTKPRTSPDGTIDLSTWSAGIPGPINTPWAGGVYTLDIHFPDTYPMGPPLVVFTPALFHPNIYPNGTVCLDLLTPQGWNPQYTVAHVLVNVQTLLCNPNPTSPAQVEAFNLYVNDHAKYEQVVRQIALQFTPTGAGDDAMQCD